MVRICMYLCAYIRTNKYKYVQLGTYSVLYVYVRIIRTGYVHHCFYRTYLYVTMYVLYVQSNEYVPFGDFVFVSIYTYYTLLIQYVPVRIYVRIFV